MDVSHGVKLAEDPQRPAVQWLSGLSTVSLNLVFELVARVKRHHTARLNRDGLAGARIAPGPGCLGSNLEIAEAGYLHISTLHQAVRNQHKKRVDHVL